MKQKLIVISADALCDVDMEYLKTLPNFQKYLAGGSCVERVRSVYPTITYPCHTTMMTGVWPQKHGVLGNEEFIPGVEKAPWKWFYEAVKWDEDIFKAAKRAGLTTCGIFWPVTGRHPAVDYLIDAYWPQPGDTDIREVFARAGSSEEVLDIIVRQMKDCVLRTHPATERFQTRCAREIILRYQPDLMMVHPTNIDSYRHSYGLFNDKVKKGIEETDAYIGELMEAVEEAGLLEDTNLVLTSDHGHMEVKRILSPNILLADAGFIELDGQGRLKDWQAYCLSGGTSALIYLKDPSDQEIHRRVEEYLRGLAKEGIYGFTQVFSEEEVREKEHLGGDFSFVLETDGYTSFGKSLVRPLVNSFDETDYRYGRATHGHLPDRGIWPVFYAKGPGFLENVTLKTANLVDEAPTFARVLGVDLKGADGHALEQLLKPAW